MIMQKFMHVQLDMTMPNIALTWLCEPSTATWMHPGL